VTNFEKTHTSFYRAVEEKPQINTFLNSFVKTSTVCPIHNIILFDHSFEHGEKGLM